MDYETYYDYCDDCEGAMQFHFWTETGFIITRQWSCGGGYVFTGICLCTGRWALTPDGCMDLGISWNWQYKDVYRKIKINQQYACILETNYFLSIYNVQLKLTFIY